MIEQFGDNMVIVNDVRIPATNVQIDGYPCWVEHTIGPPVWYGIYFEILFESGDIWEVSQGFYRDRPDEIEVEIHRHQSHELSDGVMHLAFPNWEAFLKLYKISVQPKCEIMMAL